MEIKDTKGAVQALSLQVSSVIGLTLTVLGILSKFLKAYDYTGAVGVISHVFSVLVPISTCLGLVRSEYRLQADKQVARGLYSYTQNNLLTEKQKLRGALLHLKQQLFVTKEEAEHLSEREIAMLALKKRETFQRVVGSDCVKMIYDSPINEWIDALVSGDDELIGDFLDYIDAFVHDVEKAVANTEFKDQVSKFTSITSLVALLMIYATTGGVPFTILAFNATINLLRDVGQLELLNAVVVPVAGQLGVSDIPELSRYRSKRYSLNES